MISTRAPEHIYVHVPFCDGKCGYCAFYSSPYELTLAARFLDAVAREMDMVLPPQGTAQTQTVYMGGGTPTVLTAPQLERLCAIVRRESAPSGDLEWTVESNPDKLTSERLDVLLEAGVNRFSIGVQALSDSVLKAIGRRHTTGDTLQCISALKARGIKNFGADLIAGLPGVSPAEWRDTLNRLVDLDPVHASVYALSIEDGAAWAGQIRAGIRRPPDESAAIEAVDTAEAVLTAAGYARYEISNYARPAFQCRHNLACWRGEDYLGFGPAAASRSGLQRWTNAPDVTAYAEALGTGRPPPGEHETLQADDDFSERFVFTLRLAEGVHMDTFQAIHNVSPDLVRQWQITLTKLAGHGLCTFDSGIWRLTPQGRSLADSVAAELLE